MLLMKNRYRGYRYSGTSLILSKNCHHLNPAGFLSKKLEKKGTYVLPKKVGNTALIPLSVLQLLPTIQQSQVQVLPQGGVNQSYS